MESLFDVLGRSPVHPFPARMAPKIALDALRDVKRGDLRVLDPMMGSGTVLAVAKTLGHRAIGFDMDPLAVVMAKSWVSHIDGERVRSVAKKIIRDAKDEFPSFPVGSAYPAECDHETKAFIRYWFDGYARRQLALLSHGIRKIRDNQIRTILWCAFSRLIISKNNGASLAMDLSHSRPHKTFQKAPQKPFPSFINSVEHVIKNCIQKHTRNSGPIADVRLGDARRLPLHASSVDMIVTSPPYLNAIDYMRCSKFSLVWMGHNLTHLRTLRATSIGTENARREATGVIPDSILGSTANLPNRQKEMLRVYVEDMQLALQEASRVLKPSGKAIYVMGDCVVRGTFVSNSSILSSVAESCGLRCVNKSTRELPPNRRYLPPPSSGKSHLDGRLRKEVVLTFEHA